MNESNDRDGLAAEYVLGTLDAGERAQALALLTADHAVAAKVRIWERRLSELHLMVEPIEPDGEIWDRIRHKIPHRSASVPVPDPVVPLSLWSMLSPRPRPNRRLRKPQPPRQTRHRCRSRRRFRRPRLWCFRRLCRPRPRISRS